VQRDDVNVHLLDKVDKIMTFQPAIRPIPYPYRAMMAICSDLDETPDFDMPPDQFAYWNTDDAGREMVRTLIRSGHIDCLHSYGDLATTRKHAALALDELDRHDCRLEVWVDHGTAATNFDSTIMQGHGDEIGHEAYHADLTIQYGIRYVWRGRVTSINGQNVRPRFGRIFSLAHPVQSTNTMAKELAKHFLAMGDNSKYAMHRGNKLIRPVTLRDGTIVQEFIRYNPHWGGPGKDSEPEQLAEALGPTLVARLVQSGAVGVLYTHLGKMGDCNGVMNPTVIERFRMLGELFREQHLLVCTTKRLLQYINARNHLRFDVEGDSKKCVVTIEGVDDPVLGTRVPTIDEIEGITFVVPQRESVRLMLGNTVLESKTTRKDGNLHVAVPWRKLAFPFV